MPHKTEGELLPDHPGCGETPQVWTAGLTPFHGCALLGVRPMWMWGKPAQPNLDLGVGKKGLPLLSCKKKTIHHGGRGKQYLINNSAAPVPQELIGPEKNTKVT